LDIDEAAAEFQTQPPGGEAKRPRSELKSWDVLPHRDGQDQQHGRVEDHNVDHRCASVAVCGVRGCSNASRFCKTI
jgi:hypothetical protein